MPVKLDKRDWKILEALCMDARQSHNQIARQVGLSKNAVSNRIDRLFRNKVITRFFTIISSAALGLDFYEVLIKLHKNEDTTELIDYIQKHPHIIAADRIVGKWDIILEMGCYDQRTFYEIIENFKGKFNKQISNYEAHPVLRAYKVEQLPIELIKPKEPKPFVNELIEIDAVDYKLLHLLDKDTTTKVHILAEKVGLTAETVTNRLKKLREKKIILRHTAQINLQALDYMGYVVRLDLENISAGMDKALTSYLIQHKHIRYAMMSASQQSVFVFFAAKTIDGLDDFLSEIKVKFDPILLNVEHYLLRGASYKYSLFPKGFVR